MATLNKFFTNILLLGLTISIVTYLFGVYNFDPLWKSPFLPLTKWQDWFSIDIYNAIIFGSSAALFGVAALLLRQGTYAIYAMLLAALGIVIRPVGDVVLAMPKAIGTWLPNSTNPLPPDPVTGVYPTNPIVVVISLVYVFAAFWFIFSLVIQRDIG